MGIGGIYANEVPDGGTFEAGDNILVARGPYVVAVPKDELPSGGGGSVSIRVDSATFAAIPTLTTACFVFVAADETNDDLKTVYFFDGSELQWLPSVGV